MTTATTPTVVHVVAKTHLDCGFTDTAAVVVDRYLTEYFPRALAVARQLRDLGGPERFVWTTGSWLVHTALHQTDPTRRRAVEAGVERGDLAWHALPFTTHTELADPELIRAGLAISTQLDDRFGRRTIAAKLTDVPGHTIGLVPRLAEAGVRFLHIGVNPASTVPEVPPVFLWRDEVSHTEVVVMYEAGGYGGARGVAGTSDVLAFAHTDDNGGPQNLDTVVATWARLRGQFPGATFRAGTLDDYAATLDPDVVASLPVVDKEIGDTWVHGVASDPTKVARLRSLQRVHTGWRAEGVTDSWIDDMAEQMALVVEHTWGLDEKLWFPDTTHYAPSALAAIIDTPAAIAFEASWTEQRAYLDAAVDAIIGDERHAEAMAALAAVDTTPPPDMQGWTTVNGPVAFGRWLLELDPVTGAISSLRDTDGATVLGGGALGLFSYESFDEADYRRFFDAYNVEPGRSEGWAELDFTKPGIDAAGARSGLWTATEAVAMTDGSNRVMVSLTMPDAALNDLGCPRRVWLELTAIDGHSFEVALAWTEKLASRLPEALWLSLVPGGASGPTTCWELHKLGRWVDPRHVVSRGNRSLHAVSEMGARRRPGPDRPVDVSVRPLDTPLLAPGRPSLLRFDDALPHPDDGVHALVYDNVWGTNFPMWFADAFRARFRISVGSGGGDRLGVAP